MTTAQRVSRSVVQNRIEPFARLYDPDAEEETFDLTAPKRQTDDQRRLVSLPLKMEKGGRYTRYRLTRLSKNPHCCYCDCELNAESASLDHVLPQSKGGDHWPANLLLACSDCNGAKSSFTFAEWLDALLKSVHRPNAIIAKLQRLIESGLESLLPEPIKIPPKRANISSSVPTDTVDKNEFCIGRRQFSVVLKANRKVLIRGIAGTDLRHYLDAVGFDNNGPIALVATERWRPLIGGEVIYP
jgi:hypothetical protein